MEQSDFVFKLTPFAHQMEVWRASRDLEAFGLLMEQGTGKTKVCYDTAAWLYANGRINAVLVVAPNGVHRNWTEREAPTHIPDYIPWQAAYYVSPSNITKAEKKRLADLWTFDGLRILAMHVDAFSRKEGTEYAKKWLLAHRALMAVDESSTIKTPGAARTKNLIVCGRRAKYRRILTGTPYTQNPLDIFSQFKFLDPSFLGFNSFVAFRSEYATTEQRENKAASAKRGRPVFYEEVTGYRNLDELKKSVDAHSYRVRKADCLDLPAKLYERRPVLLSAEQRRLYRQMLDESRAFLNSVGRQEGIPENWSEMAPEDQLLWVMEHGDDLDTISAPNAAVKLTRLQQIVGGYFDGKPVAATNPRIESLLGLIEECSDKVIIWARFRDELAGITEALSKAYGEESVVEYHGGVKAADREVSVDRFCKDPAARFFVSQPHAGGYGLTLVQANVVVYYSSDFSLEARLQSEDRAHRIGQTRNVTYVDLVADGTVDDKVLQSIMDKRAMADRMTGDDNGDSVHSSRADAVNG